MKTKQFLSLCACALLFINCDSSPRAPLNENSQEKEFCVAAYNVENLFDAKDDPGVDDAEFIPAGKMNWTDEKYHTKLNNIAKVIHAINDGKGPDVIGLTEVENAGVLKDLLATKDLKSSGYSFVHEESPDRRGIDVCMLYKKNSFKVLGHKMLHVDISQYDEKPTRDIMMVQGIAGKNDTLYLFINHWPSRRGGTKESEPKRAVAATVLRTAVDSVMLIHPQAKLIMLGDFNDNPTDNSLANILKAQKIIDLNGKNSLYDADNIFDWKKGEGTEFYRGDWSRFIQFIFSTSLIRDQLGADGLFHDIYIFKPDWLVIADPAYQQMLPHRTFEEDSKEIGFSDHLPVYVLLKIE